MNSAVSVLALLFVTAVLTFVFAIPANMLFGLYIAEPRWISYPVCALLTTWMLRLSWRTVAENAGIQRAKIHHEDTKSTKF